MKQIASKGIINEFSSLVSTKPIVSPIFFWPFCCFLAILLFTSSINYFKIREIFWAVELPPYMFCSIVCLLVVFIVGFKKGIVHINPIDLAIFIFFIYSASSAFILAFPFPPVDRIYNLLACMVLYAGIRLSGFFRNGSTSALYGLLFVMLLQALWGLLQHFNLVPAFTGTLGIQGGFINPGLFGCFMAVGLVLMLHLIFIYKGSKSGLILLCVLTIPIILALIFSLSRTAYISALAGTCFLLFFHLRDKYENWLIRFRFLLTGAIALIFIAIVYYLWKQNTLSVSGRFLIWKISSLIFIYHPFLGIGYGNFFTEYGNYQAMYFQSGKGTLEEMQTAGLNYYPFNELFKIAIENGIIGLGLFLWVIINTCIKGYSLIIKKKPDAIIFMAMLMVILIFGLFSYPLQSDAFNSIFYISIAAIVSAQKPVYTFRFNRIIKIFISVPVFLMCFLCLRKINALLEWRDVQTSLVYAEGDALRNYEKIYQVMDNNGAFLFNYGAVLASMDVNDKSLIMLNLAKRYLSSPDLNTSLATVNKRMQHYEEAQRYYTIAAYMDPKKFVPLHTLFNFYRETGQTLKAQKIARQLLNKPVKIPSVRIEEIKDNAREYLSTLQNNNSYR